MSTKVAGVVTSTTCGNDSVEQHLREPLVNLPIETGKDHVYGCMWTLATASLNLGTVVLTSFISRSGDIPTYTQNFTRCLAAAFSMFTIAIIRRESLLPSRLIARQCLTFGVADWFFLWGYVKALIYVSVLQYTVINTSFGPVVSALMGLLMLGEETSGYKIFGLLRNVILAFLITNPLGDNSSVSTFMTGFLWVIVAAAGTGAMRIVQRSNTAIPPIVFMFWGYVLNTLLWLPPGCIPPKVRVTFLWPSVPQDSTDMFGLPVSTWIVMSLSGVLGASIMLAQGQALKYLDVGTYSMLVTPLALVLTVVYSSMSASLGRLVWLGVSLQALAIMVDMYQETRSRA